MTPIEIPEAAVCVANAAYDSAIARGGTTIKAMNAALAAALVAWVVPVGQAGTMPGTAGFTMAVFKTIEVGVAKPLYTLRQEKPK